MNYRIPDWRKYCLEYLSVIVLFIYVFLTICYQDVTVAPRFGVTFVESLFDGEPLSFYANSNVAGFNVEGANYDIGYFILYGIWDLPVTILKHTIGIDTASAGCLMWYKLPLVIAFLAVIHELLAIAHLLGADHKHDAEIILITITTATFFYPVWIACQCDILPILLCLAATRALFLNNVRQSILWFALALLVKPFALFWMLLAVLYHNRNLVRIVKECVCACLPLGITRLAYEFSPSHPHARQPALTENPAAFWDVTLPIGNGSSASVFIIVLMLVFIAAYIHRSDLSQQRDRIVFLLLLYIMWTSFVYTVSVAPYWIVYMAPVTVLLLALCNDADLLLLDLLGGATLIVHHILLTPWVYGGGKTYYDLLLHGLFTDEEQAASGATVAGIIRAFNIQSYEPVINAVSIGCYAAIGYIAYRRLVDGRSVKTDHESYVISTRVAIWIRILFLYAFIAATLITLIHILRG